MVGLLVITLICGAITLSGALSTTNKDLGGEGGSSTTGVTTWNRQDINCNDPQKTWREKTLCTAGGERQCTAQYCN